MKEIEQTLTSLEVAEMVGRQHSEVLKDIRRISGHLAEGKTHLSDYFIESSYKDSTGRMLNSYLLTKKGCELYSTRMTGEKGTQFAVSYIERFNQMENHIKEESKTVPSLEVALQAALEHEREIKSIKSDVTYLKGNMRIDSLQQQEIQQTGKKAVVRALGGIESVAYEEIGRKAFSSFWGEFKRHFKVPRYGDIPKVKHEEALRFIELWRPSTTLQMEIDACNSQIKMM